MTTSKPPESGGYGAPTDHGSELHALQDHFAELDIVSIGEELGRMDRGERASAFRLLHKDSELDGFGELYVPLHQELIVGLGGAEIAEVFNELDHESAAARIEAIDE